MSKLKEDKSPDPDDLHPMVLKRLAKESRVHRPTGGWVGWGCEGEVGEEGGSVVGNQIATHSASNTSDRCSLNKW